MLKINVSAVHLSQRCPRLLAYELRGERNAWRVGLTGSGRFPGRLFHDQIAAPFHQAMARSADSPVKDEVLKAISGPRDRLETTLQGLLQMHYFLPAMQRHGETLACEQVLQLGHGFQRWVSELTRFIQNILLKRQDEPRNWLTKVFHDPERLVTGVYRLRDGRNIQLSGKYDALLFDVAAREAVVMEFKGRKASHADEDFLQALLYSCLIRESAGITPRAIVFYLEEQDTEVSYSAADIASAVTNLPVLFERVVDVIDTAGKRQGRALPFTADPGLCQVCPFDPRCDQDWGTRRPVTPATPTGAGSEEAQQHLDALLQTLGSLKLPVKPVGYIAGPRFIRLKIEPFLSQGVTVKKLCNQATNLQVALHLNAPPLIQPQAGYVSVDIPRKTRVPLTLGEVWRNGQPNKPVSPVAFPIGMAIDGSVVWADLSEPTMTSILVGGTAGSGKSMFLRSAVIGLALNATPNEVRVTLIDPKRVTFTDLVGLSYLACSVLMDNLPAMERLAELVEEMENRYRLFEQHQVPDISTYNIHSKPLCHHVILIDEYADMMIEKKTRERLEIFIVRLAQKGRAAGIHLILSTQRPDSKVVTPLIKANLQLKVALKVTTATNSKVILDETGAECLVGNGDMLIGGSVAIQRLQGPLVTKTEIDEVRRIGNPNPGC